MKQTVDIRQSVVNLEIGNVESVDAAERKKERALNYPS